MTAARKRLGPAITPADDPLKTIRARLSARREYMLARETEAFYRQIFEQSPISIWIEDWAGAKAVIERLGKRRVKDLRRYFQRRPEVLDEAADAIRVIDVSAATLEMYGAPSKEAMVVATRGENMAAEERAAFLDQLIAFGEGATRFEIETREPTLDGRSIGTRLIAVIPPEHCGDWTRVITTVEDVTQRRDAEAALRDSESRYRRLVETVRAIPWEMALPAWRFTYVGPQAVEVLGYPISDWYGETFWVDHIHPDDREWAIEFCRAAAERGEDHEFEYRMIAGDGRAVWLRDIVTVIDGGGGPAVLRGFMLDITEGKTAEEALRNSEERLRAVIDNSPTAISLKQADGRMMLVNRRYEEIIGASSEAIRGKRPHEVFPPGFADSGVTHDRAVLESGEASEREEHLPLDGETRTLLTVKFPVYDAVGGVIAIGGISTDITDRKRAEEALRLSETRYRDLFEQSPIGIWEEDYSAVKRMIDAWRSEGVEDFQAFFADDPEALRRAVRAIEPIAVNRAALDIYRFQDQSAFFASLSNLKTWPHWHDFYEAELSALAHGATEFSGEHADSTADGDDLIIRSVTRIGDSYRDTWARVVTTIEDVTEQRRAQKRIDYLAHHDELTDLPNRVLFRDRLDQGIAQARRRGELLGVHLLDLDNFKDINDTLGHHVGDGLLEGVAQRLMLTVRAVDTVARLGGDEFAIIQSAPKDEQDMAVVAEKVIEVIAEPFTIDDSRLQTATTIGLAIYPNDGSDARELMQKADLALYAGKGVGRNTYRFFDEKMSVKLETRKRLEKDLQKALRRRDGFRLHYQPMVAVKDRRVVGVEALLRWRHPDHGEVPPADFVPVAESAGLIRGLGAWVLKTACRQAAAWQRTGPPLSLSVNVSAAQVVSGDFPAEVAAALEETGLDPGTLEIEITETMFLRTRDPSVGETLDALAGMGVRIAIDDFGTGFGSLTYLRRFPVSKVKIDGRFVHGIGHSADDEATVRAVIALAHSFDIRILAEGIETEAQLAFLVAEGCDEGQGYYFGRPVAADDVRLADAAAG